MSQNYHECKMRYWLWDTFKSLKILWRTYSCFKVIKFLLPQSHGCHFFPKNGNLEQRYSIINQHLEQCLAHMQWIFEIIVDWLIATWYWVSNSSKISSFSPIFPRMLLSYPLRVLPQGSLTWTPRNTKISYTISRCGEGADMSWVHWSKSICAAPG